MPVIILGHGDNLGMWAEVEEGFDLLYQESLKRNVAPAQLPDARFGRSGRPEPLSVLAEQLWWYATAGNPV
jgi:hypothetical protein